MAREAITDRLAVLGKQVTKLRDTNPKTPWVQIKEQLGIGQGKVMLAYLFYNTPDGEKITGTDAAVAKAIVKQRDGGTSWAILSARTGLPESRCRKIYEDTTGSSTKGNRIGKGGRYPGDASPNGNGTAKKVAPAKKAGAAKKVAPAKKASPVKKAAKAAPVAKAAKATKAGKATKATKASKASGTPTPGTTDGGSKGALVDLTTDQLKERLEGRGISVVREGLKAKAFRVRSVTRSEDGSVTFIDAKTMNTHTVRLDDIKRITAA